MERIGSFTHYSINMTEAFSAFLDILPAAPANDAMATGTFQRVLSFWCERGWNEYVFCALWDVVRRIRCFGKVLS